MKAMVFGAGVSGNGALNLLKKMGYEVVLVDDKKGMSSQEVLEKGILDEIELFVKSPGTPYNELVLQAKKKNLKLIDEIELAYEYMKKQNFDKKIIAITGTNGKTTTTTKITELLQFAGKKAVYAGNIGVSLAQILVDEIEFDYLVLELSSFQLENLIDFKPFISMIINLTPDHLSRYKDVDDYYKTKFNICKNQGLHEFFIFNCDSLEIVERKSLIPTQKITISKFDNKDCDYYVEDGKIYYLGKEVANCEKLALKGQHNLENILFIMATCEKCGVSFEVIREFLYNTKTLEHRMENVLEYGKIKFINDSKATNIDSSKFAIEACKGEVLICGGFDKGLEWIELSKLIKDNISYVYFIGAITDILKEKTLEVGYEPSKINCAYDIKTALLDIKSRFDKNEEKTILFSPATSSFDQFKNFEERGKIYKELVKEIFGR